MKHVRENFPARVFSSLTFARSSVSDCDNAIINENTIERRPNETCEKSRKSLQGWLHLCRRSPRNGLDPLDLFCIFRSFSQERFNPRL